MTDIAGPPQAILERAQAWAAAAGATSEWVNVVAPLYWYAAPAFGIRPEVAFAQACKETGLGRFGGTDPVFSAQASWHNPCGLKNTAGTSTFIFDAWATGVRAHLEHLRLYVGLPDLPQGVIDPRHFASLSGKGPTLESPGWWGQGPEYGPSVRDHYLVPLLATQEASVTKGLCYLAVGHGLRPDGSFDPGAISDGTKEYDLARKVCGTAGDLIQNQYGHNLYTEYGLGYSRDPDYIGSAAKANAMRADVAIEVHFDWSGAPRGGTGLFVSADGSRWASLIAYIGGLGGLAFRGNTYRPDLYFLNATDMPSVLWECDRVGPDITDAECVTIGKAIAAGTDIFMRGKGL